MRVLGIESSCDETAAAVVEDGRHILSNVIHSQIKTHVPYGGIVPELASREHLAKIRGIVDKALAFHNEDRWNSAMEMRAAVLDAQVRLGLKMTREALGQIVRSVAALTTSSIDTHSTPITPAGMTPGQTERLPHGSGG